MSLSLRIEPRTTHLVARFTGEFTLRDAQDLSQRIFDACIEHGLSKVLVDHRTVQGQMSVVERWDYAVFLANKHVDYAAKGRLPALRLAYVGTHPLTDPRKFGETVAVNRGVNVLATTDLDEALRWLEVEPADEAGAADRE